MNIHETIETLHQTNLEAAIIPNEKERITALLTINNTILINFLKIFVEFKEELKK